MGSLRQSMGSPWGLWGLFEGSVGVYESLWDSIGSLQGSLGVYGGLWGLYGGLWGDDGAVVAPLHPEAHHAAQAEHLPVHLPQHRAWGGHGGSLWGPMGSL